MTTKKTTPVKPQTRPAPARATSPYHRLHTLLHTVRCIAQYEDALCELSHEVKQAGLLSDEARVALEGILKKIPSHDYVHDLDAATLLLAGSGMPASSAPRETSTSAAPKSATTRKRFSVTKQSGGKSSK